MENQNSSKQEKDSAVQSAETKPTPELKADHTELLGDLQAWIEFALERVKFRSGRVPPTFTDGYSYVEIPEWAMRQNLARIRMALEGITEEDVEENTKPVSVACLARYRVQPSS
jgi:hypothetical protein